MNVGPKPLFLLKFTFSHFSFTLISNGRLLQDVAFLTWYRQIQKLKNILCKRSQSVTIWRNVNVLPYLSRETVTYLWSRTLIYAGGIRCDKGKVRHKLKIWGEKVRQGMKIQHQAKEIFNYQFSEQWLYPAPCFWGEALKMTDEPAWSSGAPLTTGEKTFPFT